MHIIEEAQRSDAPAVADVICASIRELCGADHHDDSATISAWTAKKTRENTLGWIIDPGMVVLVSRAGQEIAAVGMLRGEEILLNYVAPAHRFAGHSKAILAAMEEMIRAAGFTEACLKSTVTAHRFYEVHGWHDSAPATYAQGLNRQPMAKSLAQEPGGQD